MSVWEFSKALNSHAIQSLIHGSKNILNTPAKELRPKELSKSKTTFTISSKDIRDIHGQLNPGMVVTDEEIEERFARAINVFKGRSKSILPLSIKVHTDSTGLTRLVATEVSYDGGIDAIVEAIFGSNAGKIVLSAYQKGHIQSLATSSLENVSKTFTTSASRDTMRTEFGNILDQIIKHLNKLDQDSSNLPEVYGKIVANTVKSHKRHIIELQIPAENMESGGLAGTITGPLRDFVNSQVKGNYLSSFNALYKALETTGANKELLKLLIETKGSPSFLELLELRLLYEIDPKNHKFQDKTYSLRNVPAGQLSLFKPDKASISQLKNKIRQEILNLKKLKENLKKKSDQRLRDEKGRFTSIANIQALINIRLHDQIKKNMGTGDRRDILNYRTGRFAETSRVDRAIFNRAGTLEIFYNYMRFPYATFSPGGAQGTPKSRDPNLLISKSIREIATSLVTNRLRVLPI